MELGRHDASSPFLDAVEACKIMDIERLKKNAAIRCRSKCRRFA